MNENSMDNNTILVEHSSTEQGPHVNKERHEKSTQNESISAKMATVTNKKQKTPIIPTPLEYSCWSRHRSSTAAGAFAVFTVVAMVIGILTVRFTSPQAIGMLFFIDMLATYCR
ncbi:unnamed protein product [Rotaria sp. Silwood1]|nr:unnamed protein product [Rotaria sp. Silwood1]CAF3654319.1 unnamed protein product [Rotaria sp. Silwood1]CAF3682712.1 unnamed protein product [Rotaria sp. Silwood1]CAF3775057.1 unnamed protein product [Rotaria sp. Silwood1]CAF4615932.1 unnamed protein product [Rotaria sp. Silwood1]